MTCAAPVDSPDPGDELFQKVEEHLRDGNGWLAMRTYTAAPGGYRAMYLGFPCTAVASVVKPSKP